jgi:hypothetical protein
MRERWAYLDLIRSLGAEVREILLKRHCAVWPACQDLHWAAWISLYGDETARGILSEIEEVALERKAEIEAKGKAESVP